MSLFHNIVERLDLADGARGAVLGIVARDGRFMGRTAVNRARLRHPMAADRLDEETLGGVLIALLRQQAIQGLARLLDRTIQLVPLALDFAVRLVHPPAAPHRTLTPVQRLFQQGTVWHNPALDGGGGDRPPAFLQECFDMPGAQGIRPIPTHTPEDDLRWAMSPLETDCPLGLPHGALLVMTGAHTANGLKGNFATKPSGGSSPAL
jgi:hypothetical protein